MPHFYSSSKLMSQEYYGFMILCPTGDHDDDYHEDDVGVDKMPSSPSAYTSFCLVSGNLGTKKNKIQCVITCGSNSL
jgi:hypothetical protein